MNRLDHRARVDAGTINRLVEAMKSIKGNLTTGFGGDSTALEMYAALNCGPAYLVEDLVACPSHPSGPTWLHRRESLPKLTITGGQRWDVHARAAVLRWLSRGGETDWGRGHDNEDLRDVVDGDLLLLGSAYQLDGACKYTGAGDGVYYTDPYDGLGYPSVRPQLDSGSGSYDPTKFVGTGPPAWTDFAAAAYDLYSGLTRIYSTWGVNPASPSGVGWTHGWEEGEGLYENFPVTMESPSPTLAGGKVGANVTIIQDVPGDPVAGALRSVINFSGEAISLNRIMQRIPDGCIDIDVRLEVTTDAKRILQTWTNTVTGGTLVNTEFETVETYEEMAYTIMGRRVLGDGRSQWDALASTGTLTGADGLSRVVDISGAVAAVINNHRGKSPYCDFCLVPAPYAGIAGGTDTRAYLKALLPNIEWAAYLDPMFDGTLYGASPVYGGGDIVYQATGSQSWVEWNSMTLGKVWVGFKYPQSEIGREVWPVNWPPMH